MAYVRTGLATSEGPSQTERTDQTTMTQNRRVSLALALVAGGVLFLLMLPTILGRLLL